MSAEIITALISATVTLLVSIGTWHVTMRQYRIKNEGMVTKAIEDVKDTVTANNADIQQHLALIDLQIKNMTDTMDLKIETLSERVERHNQVIERTRVLEKDIAVYGEQIADIRARMA